MSVAAGGSTLKPPYGLVLVDVGVGLAALSVAAAQPENSSAAAIATAAVAVTRFAFLAVFEAVMLSPISHYFYLFTY
jgi:precorrin-6B methylase 2